MGEESNFSMFETKIIRLDHHHWMNGRKKNSFVCQIKLKTRQKTMCVREREREYQFGT